MVSVVKRQDLVAFTYEYPNQDVKLSVAVVVAQQKRAVRQSNGPMP